MRDIIEVVRKIDDLPPGNGEVQALALLGLAEAYRDHHELYVTFCEAARLRDQGQRDRYLRAIVTALEERLAAELASRRPPPQLKI